MEEMKNVMGGRKLFLVSVVFATACAFCMFKVITPAIWERVSLYVLIAFCGANGMEHIANAIKAIKGK